MDDPWLLHVQLRWSIRVSGYNTESLVYHIRKRVSRVPRILHDKNYICPIEDMRIVHVITMGRQ